MENEQEVAVKERTMESMSLPLLANDNLNGFRNSGYCVRKSERIPISSLLLDDDRRRTLQRTESEHAKA